MRAIVNATPLIALSMVGQLDILHHLFDEVIVPQVVYDEVVTYGAGRIGTNAVAQATWIEIMNPSQEAVVEPLLLGLDAGELAVLLLAREIEADWILLDERLGRRIAKAFKLPVKGTLGILLAAVIAGLMEKQEATKKVACSAQQSRHAERSRSIWPRSLGFARDDG